ncbi:hypothetical protein J7L06_04485, partial [Candidatus Bathyarchaeota archaeon]|nr:hypothetical protein [Candidatus Bathyarchaeota archaeon]
TLGGKRSQTSQLKSEGLRLEGSHSEVAALTLSKLRENIKGVSEVYVIASLGVSAVRLNSIRYLPDI